MRMKIVSGFAAAAFGAALTVGFGTPAQAAAPRTIREPARKLSRPAAS